MRGYIPPEPDPGPLVPNSSMSQKTKDLIDAAKTVLEQMSPEAREVMYQVQRENYAKSFAARRDKEWDEVKDHLGLLWKFKVGDRVYKPKGSWWEGRVVGTYSTPDTPRGYCVQLELNHGPVQIYPEEALALLPNQGD